MEVAMIVLGRFQPFHRGHAAMISAALEYLKKKNSDKKLRICIGSSEGKNHWKIPGLQMNENK
tara:strand:+ start:2158 stop:2346 length:189 start_codon:yes stop_codon:yes gene_type:complete